jgi:hypothetical protein
VRAVATARAARRAAVQKVLTPGPDHRPDHRPGGLAACGPELGPMTAMPGQPTLRRTGLVSLPGAQRVKPLQCLGHGLDPDLAVVHPGTRLFRRS